MLERARGVAFRGLLFLGTTALMAGSALAGPRYDLRVDGLACPFCAYGIEKQLGRIDGVKSVATDIGKGQVVVEVTDGRSLDRAAVDRAVKKAGFKLRGFQPEGPR